MTTQELIDRLKATLPSRDDHEWADAAQYWCSELSMQDVIDTVAALERMHKALERLVGLERVEAPDMSGKRREFAYMHYGRDLADALDDARRALNGET
jgi:hypothetical protein